METQTNSTMLRDKCVTTQNSCVTAQTNAARQRKYRQTERGKIAYRARLATLRDETAKTKAQRRTGMAMEFDGRCQGKPREIGRDVSNKSGIIGWVDEINFQEKS